MASLNSLPDEVLKLVLHHVSIDERLGSCCLVSRRLHAAAIAATDEMHLAESSLESGLQWLSHYGHHVTCLVLLNSPHPVRQIPCPNLLQLRCVECSMQLGPAPDGSPGVIQGCTNITDLEIIGHGNSRPEGVDLDSLSSLVHLESLYVTSDEPITLSRGTLPCLTRLKSLSLSDLAAVEVLSELGSLTSLQDLSFYGKGVGGASSGAIGPSSVPGLVFPDSLTQLSLQARIEAPLLSVVPKGLLILRVCSVVEGPAEGGSSFLSCIAGLQHLTELSIEPFGRINWPPPGPAYSALTASSNLESLCLGASQPPEGAWSYVFPTAHKLPHLTFVSFQDEACEIEWATPPPAWGAADLSNMVSCCPNLCDVGNEWYMQPGRHVSELHKLTALTSLQIRYRTCDLPSFQASIEGGLAAVTQLRDLAIEVVTIQEGWVAGLLPLTCLTALTKLCCNGIRDTIRDDFRIFFLQEADWDTPVWVRLLRLCAVANQEAWDQLARLLSDPAAVVLHRAVTLDQDMQLSAHRSQMLAQGGASDQKVATLQGQLAAQRQIVADQAAQMVGLRGEVAAQQQLVAQQGFRIAALKGTTTAHQQAVAQQQQLVLQQQQQLQAQQDIVAQQAAQIAGLQGEVAAQQQAAAQQQQLVVQQQQQLQAQQQLVAQQGAQMAALQGQLQAMQGLLQGLLQRQ